MSFLLPIILPFQQNKKFRFFFLRLLVGLWQIAIIYVFQEYMLCMAHIVFAGPSLLFNAIHILDVCLFHIVCPLFTLYSIRWLIIENGHGFEIVTRSLQTDVN